MRFRFIQKIIDSIRGKIDSKFLNTFLNFYRKVNEYESKKNCISTIILGSSHAQFGFRASKGQMNLGLSYQDLYYSYKLFEKYNNPNIKKVILFYSVFSPGNQLIYTDDAYLSIIFKLICDIPYQDESFAKKLGLFSKENHYRKNIEKSIKKYSLDKNNYGNEKDYMTAFQFVKPEERATLHYKNNLRQNNQTKYAQKIFELANECNQKVYVVVSPATEEYKKHIPSYEELFKDLNNAAKPYNNVQIINFYNETFDKDEFVDWDHLNLKGADKLTKIVNEIVEAK